MRANGAAAIGAALVALTSTAHSQSLIEHSAEVRMQLDLAVSPAALKALLPDGWEPFVATSGPAKDCNVRLIFVDRVDINKPDGAPAGTEQMVYFASPIKKSGSNEMAGQMVIDGVTANAKDAPGPFNVYQAAASYRVERSTHATAGGPIENEETWDFTGRDGEHLGLHLTYERGVARKLAAETKFFSAANPSFYQIWKVDQGLDIMRNATVPVKDRVKTLELKASGGRVAKLFDGSERVLSVDALHWYNRGVSSP
ncbi:MAG: hypothetical protein WAV27_26040 [Xanthobacteraceae bacterium]